MLLKCTLLEYGPGPSEAIIEVRTENGAEEVIVDRDVLHKNSVDVGFEIARRNGHVLLELPRETVSGQSRVWVPKEDVVAAETAAA